ncbi:hypothetical protein D3C79_790630 [compost metagenome]
MLGRGTLGDDLQVIGGDHADIAALHQQATVDALEVPTGSALGWPLAALQQTYVLFGSHHVAGGLGDFRGDDHFDELAVDNGLGGFAVQFTVECDDAAERRFGVGRVSQVVGFADAAFVFRYYRHAARVGVLDDDAGRLDEALYAFQRGVSVGHVVE